MQGNVVSAYFFVITIAQTIAPALFQVFAVRYDAFSNPKVYGPLIAAFTAVCYLGSVPFWYRAGKNYVKEMRAKNEQSSMDSALI